MKTAIRLILLLTALTASWTPAFALEPAQVSLAENYRRVLTPNNDGYNDIAFFLMNNPADAALTGQVYDVTGAVVAEMRRDVTNAQYALVWDGKDSAGNFVPQGAYVYKIAGGERPITGAMFVAK